MAAVGAVSNCSSWKTKGRYDGAVEEGVVIDRAELLARVDLVALVEGTTGPGRRSGAGVMFRCPWHAGGGERTGSLWVTPDNGRWHCFGCGEGGTAIDWVMRRDGVAFREACEVLGGEDVAQASPAPRRAAPVLVAPGEVWQGRAWEFVEGAMGALWEEGGKRALQWLYERGLEPPTLLKWKVGYWGEERFEGREDWGLEAVEVNGRKKRVWLPRGVVIPNEIDGVLWAVKVNRPGGYVGKGPKYVQVSGSRNVLFGVDGVRGGGRPLWVDEGEWNMLSVWQEAEDLVDVVSCGAASIDPGRLGQWWGLFLGARLVLVRVDDDEAGERAWGRWEGLLGGRARRVSAPEGGDSNGFLMGGGDVRAWVEFELARAGVGYAK